MFAATCRTLRVLTHSTASYPQNRNLLIFIPLHKSQNPKHTVCRRENYASCQHYLLYFGNRRCNQLGFVRFVRAQSRFASVCRSENGWFDYHLFDYRSCGALVNSFAVHHGRRALAQKQTRGVSERKEADFLLKESPLFSFGILTLFLLYDIIKLLNLKGENGYVKRITR